MNSFFKSIYQQTTNVFFGFLKNIVYNFMLLTVKNHYGISIVGFVVILSIIMQLISGISLAFSLIPETMLVPSVRDEEDIDALFTDDFFWLHERGVDVIFIFTYMHLARKLYLINSYLAQEFAWKSGAFLLMLLQIVTFLGLVLCCTHLSDVTLKIASNTMHQVFMLKTKVYWWLFTDMKLNTDTLIRLAYLHYISAFIFFALAIFHAVDMHYDWTSDANTDFLKNEQQWWNEVVINEIVTFLYFMFAVFFIALLTYTEPYAIHYELFMWGDLGFIPDVQYQYVAPHWYFRPLMAFLLVIPHALLGVFGLALFFILIYYQISLHKLNESRTRTESLTTKLDGTDDYKLVKIHIDYNFTYQLRFYIFFMACMYTTTFLPNGKYYSLVGGNDAMLASYIIVLLHLTFPPKPVITSKKTNIL